MSRSRRVAAGDTLPMRQLPPLPYGFFWRRCPGGRGELTIWGNEAVARVEPIDSGWRTMVNVCFHESLHRGAIAGTKRQACYWVHRWAIARAEGIYMARPEACVLVRPRSLLG